jgi:ion channel-forming bestrophin family protein
MTLPYNRLTTTTMLVRQHLRLWRAVPYVKYELLLATVVSVVVYTVYDFGGVDGVGLPNVLPAVLGAAVAILLGFRNAAAYGRWSEAVALWYNIANASRILARLTVTFVDSHMHTPAYDATRASNFKKQLIYMTIAWVAALKREIRASDSDGNLQKSLLTIEDLNYLESKQNVPTSILVQIGHLIYDGMRDGTLQGFDSFQMEGQLAQLATLSTNCVRLKEIPIPRQYSFFTRLIVWFFIIVLPFSFVDSLGNADPDVSWMVIPITILMAFVFGIIERTGAVNEDPYANRITGIPLEAITRTVERDLREILDETGLPEPVAVVDGIWE